MTTPALLDLRAIGAQLAQQRSKRNLSLRQAAQQAGVTHYTFHRAEQGRPTLGEHFLRVLAWANTPGAAVTLRALATPEKPHGKAQRSAT